MSAETDSLFEDKAELYASARPQYPKALYEFLAAQVEEAGSAWDAACGNGQAAVDLARYFSLVEASDVSEAQIANAIAKPNIHYRVCRSENTEFADDQFDLVCVAQALHWFEHDEFWPEIARVLKPGGVFAVWGYNWPRLDAPLNTHLQETLFNPIEGYWAAQNQLIWNYYTDLNIPFTQLETPPFSMTVEWDLTQFYAFLHTMSATRRCMDVEGDDFFLASFEGAKSIWGDAASRKQISFDFFLLAYRV